MMKTMNKTDEELRAEANALDAAYTSAALFDAKNEIKYLKSVLTELVCQIQEDVAVDSVTEHFWEAVDAAEEALGHYDE